MLNSVKKTLNSNLVEIKNLTKKYGNVCVVDNISMSVQKGEVIGFLGLNGAGKSTTMDMVTSCLSPTSGKIEIGGYDVFKYPTEARRLVGYLPDVPPLYGYMTVTEYLKFVSDLKGVSNINKEVARVIDETCLGEKRKSLISTLSKGYKQRVGLAQALVGNPTVLVLDEPTSGLDPAQVVQIRNLFKGLAKDHTIILSTHILSEVEQVCNRVIIINKGRIIANDIRQNLSQEGYKTYSLRVYCQGSQDILNTVKSANESFIVKNLVQLSTNVFEFDLEISKDVQENDIYLTVSKALIANDVSVLQFKNVSQSIEKVFLSLVETDNSKKDVKSEFDNERKGVEF